MRKVIYMNEDNEHFYAYHSSDEMTREGLEALVDHYADRQHFISSTASRQDICTQNSTHWKCCRLRSKATLSGQNYICLGNN